ncbi:hypothetical protein [Vibrio furnissii]|uniref:hypothetical protein n=1 Tax=Vibrio furnissii TaxID=29494 RepID=UPI001E652E58|nr:hypothetical protein [Vibrio furnissii]UHJ62962.1 hypothetical protein LUM42_18325 [Vibrio furnissii]
MINLLKTGMLTLCQWFIFLPGLLCFSYLLRPLLIVVLVPGGLLLLAVIGGQEVRSEMKNLFKGWVTSR